MIEFSVEAEDRSHTLQFEHSLISLSKWEAKHRVAFLGRTAKSPDQMIDYFQEMLISPDVDRTLVYRLAPEEQDALTDYINASNTATKVPKDDQTGSPETLTSEVIYYYLAELGIPFEPTNSWHLSRTMALIELTAWKKAPPKKRKPSEVWRDWASQNEKNKEILGIKD